MELHYYSQTVVATSLWAVALDHMLDENALWDNLRQNDAIIEAWEKLVLIMFGNGAIVQIEKFG